MVVVQGDVSRDEDCKKIVAAAAPWGRLDALINNAGTTKHMAHGNLDGLSAEDFQRLFGVNTIGPFQMVRAARSLLEAGAKASGRASAVVNVSSVAGISGVGSSIAYAASKGALNTMTYSLARALAPLIRVNTVCPGYIDTPWFTKGRGEEGAKQVRDSVVAKVPLKVASSADDIAALVCFLATPQSSNMTGELVRMDAGMHLIRETTAIISRRRPGREPGPITTRLLYAATLPRARLLRHGVWVPARGRDDGYAVTSIPDRKSRRLATSRFQMNSTTSAPMVAVMKPAPWSGP